jgi:hypothetical protein
MMKTISFTKIAHVGNMRRDHQRQGSYEGDCLSVSIHPVAWSQIARIGHDGFVLQRIDEQPVTFLHASKLTSDEKETVKNWAFENDLLSMREIYVASYFDVEDEARRSFECDSHRDALDELEGLPCPRIKGPFSRFTASPKLLEASNQKLNQTLPSDLAFDLALIAYTRENLSVDGVWWNERLAPETLSAPRGALFNERISALECIPADFSNLGPRESIENHDFDVGLKPTF